MDKKYQVFISSTYTDLIEERQAVIEAVLNAEHIPAGMEAFKVSGKSQEEIIRRWIEESDIYVLILGPRYGSKNQDGISYTQWEYNLAKELNKPMFSIVLTDDYINGMVSQGRITATSFETQLPEYKTFKEEVSGTLVHMINNIESIKLGVSDSIRQIQRDENDKLEGWIKGHHLIELDALRKENKELLEKLTNRQDEVIDMQKDLNAVVNNNIGDYKFSYIKLKLAEQEFDYDVLQNNIQKYEAEAEVHRKNKDLYGISNSAEHYFKELNKIGSEKKNALEWLMDYRKKLLTTGIDIYTGDFIGEITNEYIFSKWYQYALIEKSNHLSSNFGGRSQSSYVKIVLSENGRKFLTMLEMEEEQTK